MIDHDQGGVNLAQQVLAACGPSLGWQRQVVSPEFFVTSGGTKTLPWCCNCARELQRRGDDRVAFSRQPVSTSANPAPSPVFGQAIWVKDLGGFASAANPIVIQPFDGNLIDGLASFSIITPFDLIRLYVLTDQSGYYSG